MLIPFDTVQIVYICVFMTCPTSYCLSDKLMDPWNVCVCMCVCSSHSFKFWWTRYL